MKVMPRLVIEASLGITEIKIFTYGYNFTPFLVKAYQLFGVANLELTHQVNKPTLSTINSLR